MYSVSYPTLSVTLRTFNPIPEKRAGEGKGEGDKPSLSPVLDHGRSGRHRQVGKLIQGCTDFRMQSRNSNRALIRD